MAVIDLDHPLWQVAQGVFGDVGRDLQSTHGRPGHPAEIVKGEVFHVTGQLAQFDQQLAIDRHSDFVVLAEDEWAVIDAGDRVQDVPCPIRQRVDHFLAGLRAIR
jgi:hypothetical protein